MINSLFHLLATATACQNPSITSPSNSCTGLPVVSATSGELHNALTIFFGIAGVISVLMIVIGGMMFVTSGGSPENAAKARDTIIYAVVGLLVSVSAEVLVAFVLGKL